MAKKFLVFRIFNVCYHIHKLLSFSLKPNHLSIIIPAMITSLNWHLPLRLSDYNLYASPTSLSFVNHKCNTTLKRCANIVAQFLDGIQILIYMSLIYISKLWCIRCNICIKSSMFQTICFINRGLLSFSLRFM